MRACAPYCDTPELGVTAPTILGLLNDAADDANSGNKSLAFELSHESMRNLTPPCHAGSRTVTSSLLYDSVTQGGGKERATQPTPGRYV